MPRPIDFAKRIADALGVSLDHLVGEGINAHFDKKTLQRIQEVEKFDEDTKEKVYFPKSPRYGTQEF